MGGDGMGGDGWGVERLTSTRREKERDRNGG